MPFVDGKYVAPSAGARTITYKPEVQDPQLQKLIGIAQKNNVQVQPEQPKLGVLQRIISGLGFLQTGPAIKAVIEGKNPITAYTENTKARLSEAITGKPSEVPQFNFEKDIIEKLGGQAKTAGGEVAQSIGGVLGDILTDPITYLSGGVGSAIKTGVGKTLLKRSAVSVIKREGLNIAENAAENLIRKGVISEGERLATIRRIVESPNTGVLATRRVTQNALSGVRGYESLIEQGGLKFAGKTIIPGETFEAISKATVGRLPKPKFVEQLQNVLVRDARLAESAKEVKQRWLDLSKYNTNNDLEKWKQIIGGVTKQSDREAISNAIEQQTISSLPKTLQPIAEQTKQFLDSFAKRGIQNNILRDVRQNYVPHLYQAENAEDLLNQYARQNKVSSNFANSKRRQVATIAEAENLGLKPEKDIALLVAKYVQDFNRANSAKSYIDELVKTVGIPDNFGVLQRQKDLLLKHIDEEKAAVYAQQGVKAVDANDVILTQKRIDTIENQIAQTTEKLTKKDAQIQELEKSIGESLVPYKDANVGDILLPRSVAEDLQNKRTLFDDDDVTGLLKSYDKFLNFWKGSLTSIFPSFHARNLFSNVAQNFTDIGLDAINVVRHQDAIRVIRGVDGDFITEIGTKYPYKKLLDEAKKRNIIGGDFFHTEAAKFVEQQLPKNSLRKAVNKFSLFELGRGIGSGIENEARMVNFLSNVRKGMSLDQAAAQTKKFLFDYDNLSKFEKDVLRRIIPFYTWTRKNISLQLHLLKNKPGVIATELKAARGLGDPVSDEEKITSLPPWAAQAAGFKAGVDKFGRPLFITGLGLPIEGFAQALSLKTSVGMLSPLIKSPLEIATGQDFFRGKPISEVYNANDVAGLVDMLSKVGVNKDTAYKALDVESYQRPIYVNGKKTKEKETVYTMNPYVLYAIRVLPTSRLVNTIGLAADQQRTGLENFLRLMTGVRAYSFDQQEQQYFKELEQRKNLETDLKRRGLVGTGEYFYEKKK